MRSRPGLLCVVCVLAGCSGDPSSGATPGDGAGSSGGAAATAGMSGLGGSGGASGAGGAGGTSGEGPAGGSAGAGAGGTGGDGTGGTGGNGAGGTSTGGTGGDGTGGTGGNGTGGTGGGTGGTGGDGAGGTGGNGTGGAGGAGAGGSGGSGGSGGQGFVDPAGDAATPDLDLLAGAMYRDGDFLEFRLQFAGAPLGDGTGLGISAGFRSLSVTRDGAGLAMKALPDVALGLDACSHALLEDQANWLVLRVPAQSFPATPSSVEVATTGGGSGSGDSAVIPGPPLPYPGALPGAAPVCEPWASARTSTIAFHEISIGDGFGCGVTIAREVTCWGEETALSALGSAPAGPFESVSVAPRSWWGTGLYACGLRPSGEITCWGAAPPALAGSFRSMSDPFGCAIRDDGGLVCIDMGTGEDEIRGAPGPIAKVVGAGADACYLSEAGSIVCFGQSAAPAGNDFIDVAFGSLERACGLRGNGELDCELAFSLPYDFATIAAGSQPRTSFAVGCGLTNAGSPICWGGAGVVPPVHPGSFERLEVSSTTEGFCGFRSDATLVCWHYSHVAGTPLPATSPP